MWFTVYEASDPMIISGCDVFYRTGTRLSGCDIVFGNNDKVNGPMYTQDQFMVSGSPTFGRTLADKIKSAAPGTSNAAICTDNSCGTAVIKGQAWPNAPTISPPPDNSMLEVDASKYGQEVLRHHDDHAQRRQTRNRVVMPNSNLVLGARVGESRYLSDHLRGE